MAGTVLQPVLRTRPLTTAGNTHTDLALAYTYATPLVLRVFVSVHGRYME